MAACFDRSVMNLSVRDVQQCRRCCRIARQCAERVRSEVTRENTQRTSLLSWRGLLGPPRARSRCSVSVWGKQSRASICHPYNIVA